VSKNLNCDIVIGTDQTHQISLDLTPDKIYIRLINPTFSWFQAAILAVGLWPWVKQQQITFGVAVNGFLFSFFLLLIS